MSAWSLLKIAVENSEKLKAIDPSLPEVENAKQRQARLTGGCSPLICGTWRGVYSDADHILTSIRDRQYHSFAREL